MYRYFIVYSKDGVRRESASQSKEPGGLLPGKAPVGQPAWPSPLDIRR